MIRSKKYLGSLIVGALLLVALLVWLFYPHSNRFYVRNVASEIEPVHIQRFDQDFFTLDSAVLAQEYGSFVDLYLYQIIQLPPNRVADFQQDSAITALRYDIAQVYGYGNVHQLHASLPSSTSVLQEVEDKLTTAWAYYHHYFPQAQLPRNQFHLSGFNQSVVTAPNVVSASIENYLGADYPMYEQIAYQYETPYMTPRHLPLDMMMAWLLSEYPDASDNLLEAMVYQGKLIYLMGVFFPDETEAEILSFTPNQLRFCQQFEQNIWANMVENKELFSTDWRTITRYTQPAPFTNGYSQTDSPGRIGVYMGWRIVQEFMQRNASYSLQDLMNVTDAQQILQLSGYRP